jgi:hypothetical protein
LSDHRSGTLFNPLYLWRSVKIVPIASQLKGETACNITLSDNIIILLLSNVCLRLGQRFNRVTARDKIEKGNCLNIPSFTLCLDWRFGPHTRASTWQWPRRLDTSERSL